MADSNAKRFIPPNLRYDIQHADHLFIVLICDYELLYHITKR
jgi:hypothetical protein